MAREPKTKKSETLTIRLDPKTRFILEYLSRLRGQSITTVVERAIWTAAATETVEFHGKPISWQQLWDVSEGVRAMKVAGVAGLFPSYDEERRLAFAKEHWPFFFQDATCSRFINHYVDVLWPRIDEFIQVHEDMRSKNYFAAGERMARALGEANLEAPRWTDGNHPHIPKSEIPF